METQPSSLVHEAITPLLDEIARDYARLTGWGGMKGILLVDQDAKVIAKTTAFGPRKPWDMGGIGTLGTASHEGLHQFLACRMKDHLPMWVEEGLCTTV